MSNNSSNITSAVWQLHPVATCALCLMVIVVLACILIGNILVCLAVCLVRRLRHQPGAYLLVSLAAADFCVGLLVMPPALIDLVTGQWIFGDFLCKLWTTADVTLCTASILSLCVISVDRYYIITDPLKYAITGRTSQRMLLYICGVWSAALVVSITPLFAFPIVQIKSKCQVSQNIYYQMYATMLSFYIPTLIILVVNIQIYRVAQTLRQQDKMSQHEVGTFEPATSGPPAPVPVSPNHLNVPNGCPTSTQIIHNQNGGHLAQVHQDTNNQSGNRVSRLLNRQLRQASSMVTRSTTALSRQISSVGHGAGASNKTLKTLGVIMSCYIICWAPFFILALVKPILKLTVPKWLDAGFLWLGWLNSLLNPFIYAKFNREFRTPFWLMLRCQFSNLNNVCRNRASYATDYQQRLRTRYLHQEDNNGQVLIGQSIANNNINLTNQHTALNQGQPMNEESEVIESAIRELDNIEQRRCSQGANTFWTHEQTI